MPGADRLGCAALVRVCSARNWGDGGDSESRRRRLAGVLGWQRRSTGTIGPESAGIGCEAWALNGLYSGIISSSYGRGLEFAPRRLESVPAHSQVPGDRARAADHLRLGTGRA